MRLISQHKKWRWSRDFEDFIKQKIEGFTLHVCCGYSGLGDVRVDLDRKVKPHIVADMFHLPFRRFVFDTVVCDPPYKLAYDRRAEFIFEVRGCLKPYGRLILKLNFIPRLSGFKEEELWLYEGRRWWTDLSIIWVGRRIDQVISESLDLF